MSIIRIEGGGLTATCETAEQAAALWRLLETQVQRAPVATSLADEPAPRKRRAKAAAAESSNGHGPNGAGAFTYTTGRKPSALTVAIYEAISKNAEPDLEKLAKAHDVPLKNVNQIIWRGIGKGKIKKLAGGGWKVVG